MLKRLSINNYVLIDQLEIDLESGLSIITGETGAGKSILLGALGLMLGQRADTDTLLKKDRKCIIEGVFDIRLYKLHSFFKTYELDYDSDTSIRREITPEGKSRAFINDTPVNLNILKELSTQLVDIHSQHETLLLNNSGFQLSVVDAFAKNEKLKGEYREALSGYKKCAATLRQLKESELKSKADIDYFTFQFNELNEANLLVGEQVSLEQEQEKLAHAEEIRTQLNIVTNSLNNAEDNIIQSLNTVHQTLSQLKKFDPDFQLLDDRLKATIIEIKDINAELNRAEETVSLDPKRLEIVEDRLNNIYKLLQKHRVDTIEELISLRDHFSDKLNEIDSLEELIGKTENELANFHAILSAKGKLLTKTREDAIPEIEKVITKQLSELAMPHGIFRIALLSFDLDQFTNDGFEKVQFLFSANKGVDFRELNKVASGGELSRLMLSIKSLMAKITAMPTVIFDEIDSGISGETAAKVALILKQMAAKHQLLVITHLPQMASKGDAHYFVYKEVAKGVTHTKLKLLSKEERIKEIARMLSGEELSEAAIGNAKVLLGNN